MKLKFCKVQTFILIMYIFINTYALFYVLVNIETFGDFTVGLQNESILYLSYISVIIPFVFFNLLLIPYFQKQIKLVSVSLSIENKMSIFVLLLQLSFLAFNLIEGVNSAGSNTSTNSPIKYLFIIFAPDLFFLICYGFARDNKLFKYNLIIYLFSNFQRGWLGGLLTVLIIEFFIYYKKHGASQKLVYFSFFVGIIIVAIAPYLIAFKWAARAFFGGGGTGAGAELELILSLGNRDYLTSLIDSANYVIARFQVVSNAYLILENSRVLSAAAESGEFVSFYLVGLPQMMIFKLFGIDYQMLNSFIVSMFDPNYYIDELSYNTHTGWFSWVVAEPYLIMQYFIFSIVLVFGVTYLSAKIGGEYIYFISWLMTLMLFMQGWIHAYMSFFVALLMFWFVKFFLRILPVKRLNKSN
jgi:hypothetical protein